jgi:flagellar motor switch protein FliG
LTSATKQLGRALGQPETAPGSDAGRQRAAVLLTSISVEHSAEVLRRVGDDQMESLSLAISQLERVDRTTRDTVLDQFVDAIEHGDPVSFGGVDFASDILERALGEDEAREIIERLTASIEQRPFAFLRHSPPERIAAAARGESPQMLALMLASLHSSLAARVFSHLSPEEQADVSLRIGLLGDVNPDVLRLTEDEVRRKLAGTLHADVPQAGGPAALASILRYSTRTSERVVLNRLGEEDAGLADEVRSLLFTFDNLLELDDRAIQVVLMETPRDDVLVAMHTASTQIKAKILANVSSRNSRSLLEDIEYQPRKPRRVVEEAQGRIVTTVLRLEDEGKLVIPRNDDELVG